MHTYIGCALSVLWCTGVVLWKTMLWLHRDCLSVRWSLWCDHAVILKIHRVEPSLNAHTHVIQNVKLFWEYNWCCHHLQGWCRPEVGWCIHWAYYLVESKSGTLCGRGTPLPVILMYLTALAKTRVAWLLSLWVYFYHLKFLRERREWERDGSGTLFYCGRTPL